MILDSRGRPTNTEIERNKDRDWRNVDVFELPGGAVVSAEGSQSRLNLVKNNTTFREKLEMAARATGKSTALLESAARKKRNDTKQDPDYYLKNQKFVEGVLRRKMISDNDKLAKRSYSGLII